MPAPKISAASERYPSRSQTPSWVSGYSSNHSQHTQQTSFWSSLAYKGLNASQVGTLHVSLYVYEPTINTKGQPVIVNVSAEKQN
jgi:hypothetical protein